MQCINNKIISQFHRNYRRVVATIDEVIESLKHSQSIEKTDDANSRRITGKIRID